MSGDRELNDIDEVPSAIRCAECGGTVYWSGIAPGRWAHYDAAQQADHNAWVRA
jgi:hypothetical protein